MPSPIDSTWPTSATSASLPKWAISCLRIAEISAARISIKTSLTLCLNSPLPRPSPLTLPLHGSLPLPAGDRRRGAGRGEGQLGYYHITAVPSSADALHRQLQPLQLALEGAVDHP